MPGNRERPSCGVVSTPPTRAADVFAVQVGAYLRSGKRRNSYVINCKGQFGTARLIFRQGDQTWRVLVGMEPTQESAAL